MQDNNALLKRRSVRFELWQFKSTSTCLCIGIPVYFFSFTKLLYVFLRRGALYQIPAVHVHGNVVSVVVPCTVGI